MISDDELQQLSQIALALTLQRPTFPRPVGGDWPPIGHLMDAAFKQAEAEKRLLLPDLITENKTLALFSDYSGDHKPATFNTYAFLATAYDRMGTFQQESARLRDRLGDFRRSEISYKNLRGPFLRILADFLRVADTSIHGMLFVILVPKSIHSVMGTRRRSELTELLSDAGFGRPGAKVAERMLRISHVASYLAALLSGDGQKLFWMTDHDAIVPAPENPSNLVNLFAQCLPLYSTKRITTVGQATPFPTRDEVSLALRDALSLADLAAGALGQDYSEHAGTGQRPAKAEAILRWLAHDTPHLRKFMMVVRAAGPGGFTGSQIAISTPPSSSAILIPVPVS